MVVGLLHGLAHRHGERITVNVIARKSDGAEHDIFHIERLDKARLAKAG
jgi:hypothetical protein